MNAGGMSVVLKPLCWPWVKFMFLYAGKILRQWGSGHFFMPHMITVDRNNTVWIADAGRHQVLKFTASGKFIMAAGIKDKPGPAKTKFCKPTQVIGWLICQPNSTVRAATCLVQT